MCEPILNKAKFNSIYINLQRLNGAGQILKERINGIIKRGEDRSHFYSVVRHSFNTGLNV